MHFNAEQRFSVVFSIEKLPKMHQLCLDMQPGLALYSLYPVLDSEPSISEHERHFNQESGTSGNGLQLDHKYGMDPDEANSGEESLFCDAIEALRRAQGKAYDDIIDVSLLLSTPPADCVNQSNNYSSESSINGSGQTMLRLLIGEAVLSMPRLLKLLSHQSIRLIECSAELPHIIVDHNTALLVLEVKIFYACRRRC